jgi:hypothetical protein
MQMPGRKPCRFCFFSNIFWVESCVDCVGNLTTFLFSVTDDPLCQLQLMVSKWTGGTVFRSSVSAEFQTWWPEVFLLDAGVVFHWWRVSLIFYPVLVSSPWNMPNLVLERRMVIELKSLLLSGVNCCMLCALAVFISHWCHPQFAGN